MKLRRACAAIVALWSGGTLAADSGTRTTMPDNCSDRNVTCVINDGAPTVQQAVPSDIVQVPVRDAPPVATQLPSGPGVGNRPPPGDAAPARGRGR